MAPEPAGRNRAMVACRNTRWNTWRASAATKLSTITHLGSSLAFKYDRHAVLSFWDGSIGGMQSSSPEINPDFHDYNKLHLLQPIFDVRVTLYDSAIVFDPPIGASEFDNGIRNIINNFTDHFISLAI